jgi:hypothetical protein
VNPLRILEPFRGGRGFLVCPVHFTHDPEKAVDDWEIKNRPDFPSQDAWNREMEIDFSSQVGKPAYDSFNRAIHVRATNAEAMPTLPLCLEVDFNVAPLTWNVSQQWAQILVYIDQICIVDNARVEAGVQEFRNLYPAHPAGIEIYGDGMGHNRDVQTAQSNYDLMRAAFRGYPTPIAWMVPKNNPRERDRVNAVNRKLIGPDKKPGVVISPRCTELIADFNEVVWKEDGSKMLKVYDGNDPYHLRTHSSDAAGYHIWRVWPTITEDARIMGNRPRPPRKYGALLGTTDGARLRR